MFMEEWRKALWNLPHRVGNRYLVRGLNERGEEVEEWCDSIRIAAMVEVVSGRLWVVRRDGSRKLLARIPEAKDVE